MMANYDPIGALIREIKGQIAYFEKILLPDVSILIGIFLSLVLIIRLF